MSAVALTAVAKTCDVDCKKTCIAEGLGDTCVSTCGCETMTNGVAERFAEQQICMRQCKQQCKSNGDAQDALLCNMMCPSQCN